MYSVNAFSQANVLVSLLLSLWLLTRNVMITVVAFSYAVPSKPSNTVFGSTGSPYAPRHGSSNFLSGDVGELKIKHHIKIIINCNQKSHAKIYGSLCGPKGEKKGDHQRTYLVIFLLMVTSGIDFIPIL